MKPDLCTPQGPERKLAQRRKKRRRDRARPLSRAFRLGAEQSHGKGAPLWWRQHAGDIVERDLE